MMSLTQNTSPLFLEDVDLYCLEDQLWDDDNEYGDILEMESFEGCFSIYTDKINTVKGPIFELPALILSDDDELKQMLCKEEKNLSHMSVFQSIEKNQALVESRYEAVDWILKAQSFFSFSALTAVLAVNYLDRFIGVSLQHSFQRDKPWMFQLAAVACLFLAAKVEEIYVPLLQDIQVGETKYMFEAKTIQKMETLVLSALEWKMHPVNPLAFLDQFIHKLDWSSPIYGEFIQRCELIILLALFDARSMSYLPSVVASATILHVVSHLHTCIDEKFKHQLLGVLGTDKEKVFECYKFVRSHSQSNISNKRKFVSLPSTPGSPTSMFEATFSSESSNTSCFAASSSVTSSPEPHSKRVKKDHDCGYLHCALDEA